MSEPLSLSMPAHFTAVLVFIVAALAFIAVSLLLPRLFRPINPYAEKLSSYECGERPIGSPWIRFNIRFYIIAILFIIFDVEVLFIIPWAVQYRSLLGEIGLLVFFEMFVFLLVLGVGLAYCWAKGHLEWVLRDKEVSKSVQTTPQSLN